MFIRSRMNWFCYIVATLTSITFPGNTNGHPICLVGRDTRIYRFNADGNGSMEEFLDSGGMVVAMTLVPPGVSVAGCSAGDVLAVEGNGMNRVWRIDNPSCGTPQLIQIGAISHGVTSIAFAHGHLYGVGSGAGMREFDPVTFQAISGLIDLSPTWGTCGLAFDGITTWYALGGDGVTDMLFRFTDPPTVGGLIEIGVPGIDVGDCGLEYFDGVLWGGFRGPSARLYVGTFDLMTGAFTTVWDRPQIGTNTLGIVMLPERSAINGDINCDGKVDGLDIVSFVQAFNDLAGFAESFPNCNRINADLTGDCLINENDVQPFVNALLGS